jgi:putative phosphoesterase
MHHQPIKVAIIADTHVNHLAEFPPELRSFLGRVDLVIHLGDYTSPELLEELRQAYNFYGVAGNHDSHALHHELGEMDVVEVGGKRLGIFHGFILPFGSQRRIRSFFNEYKIDAIFYGHTHLAYRKLVDGVLMLNPGTVTGQYPAFWGSFGLVSVDGQVSGRIIRLKDSDIKLRGPFDRLRVSLFNNILRWVETWPFLDLARFLSPMVCALKKMAVSRKGTDK